MLNKEGELNYINVEKTEIPSTVSEIWDEANQKYIYSFSLDKDEKDALVIFGLHPAAEIDNHIIQRSKALITSFARKYANDCFNEKIPLDCYCEKTLFRRYYDKNNVANK